MLFYCCKTVLQFISGMWSYGTSSEYHSCMQTTKFILGEQLQPAVITIEVPLVNTTLVCKPQSLYWESNYDLLLSPLNFLL